MLSAFIVTGTGTERYRGPQHSPVQKQGWQTAGLLGPTTEASPENPFIPPSDQLLKPLRQRVGNQDPSKTAQSRGALKG